jgi:hypothetical protein
VLPPEGGREWDPQRAWVVTAWFAAERSGLPRVVRESGGASQRMARRLLPNRGFRDVDCGASRRRTSAWAKVAVTIISAPIMRRALLGAPASARRLATPCWSSLRVERVCAARPFPVWTILDDFGEGVTREPPRLFRLLRFFYAPDFPDLLCIIHSYAPTPGTLLGDSCALLVSGRGAAP